MCAKSYIAPDENRWSVEEEIEKVFKTALITCYPNLPDEEPDISICISKEPGDYRCNNFSSIYDKIYDDKIYEDGNLNFIPRKTLNSSKFIRRKRKVSEVLKKYLLKYAKDIIEKCTIEDIGFLHFTLSRSWIAKSIHKMLTNGIDTLAPKDPVKIAVIDSSSRNIDEQMNLSHLHSALIGETLARMLEFSKADVLRKRHVWGSSKVDVLQEDTTAKVLLLLHLMGVNVEIKDTSPYVSCILKVLSLLNSKRLIINSEGDQVIFIKEATIRITSDAIKKIPLTVVSRDGRFDAASDLADLWYQLKEEKADWIVYVADVETQDRKEMCFMAARLAGLLPTGRYGYPRTTFVGVGPLRGQDNKRLKDPSTDIIDLYNLLGEATRRLKPLLFALGMAKNLDNWNYKNWNYKNRNYKDRNNHWYWNVVDVKALACSVLKYEFLKLPKVREYTFNIDDMLSDKGNTLVYLLYAHTQISSIIKDSGKDMEELKKTGELILEENEERELGLHILHFNEVLNMVCSTIEPDILCEYLYELSKKFTSLCGVVGSGKETSRLLMCEATLVVMRKCFHFLGIYCPFEGCFV